MNVPINVIDSRTFLNIVSNDAKPIEDGKNQKLYFKKNLAKKLEQTKSMKFDHKDEISEPQKAPEEPSANNWFVNEEDRVMRGHDFTTKNEDLFKLMKHLKQNFTKGDFYRYQTDATEDREISSLIMCTE